MELCLVNNDPTKTLLVSSDGKPLYNIQTPSGPSAATTTVRRLQASTGKVEYEVGQVEYHASHGTKLSLCHGTENLQLVLYPNAPGNQETSWLFIGPDGRPYKWQIFIHYPVLLLNDMSQTPIARYRRAKIGIVSRSRRAFLEVFPAGINMLDLVVVTFVSFMKHHIPISNCESG